MLRQSTQILFLVSTVSKGTKKFVPKIALTHAYAFASAAFFYQVSNDSGLFEAVCQYKGTQNTRQGLLCMICIELAKHSWIEFRRGALKGGAHHCEKARYCLGDVQASGTDHSAAVQLMDPEKETLSTRDDTECENSIGKDKRHFNPLQEAFVFVFFWSLLRHNRSRCGYAAF